MELIGIWPPLPITIWNSKVPMPEDYAFDAVIMHPNRVCQINICLTSSQLQRLASAMQEPFPALTHLLLDIPSSSRPAPALPDGFLGGSAARLQFLKLESIPFPALPKLLLSATDLVHLDIWDIPHSGYISPEAIVTALAVLANLRNLFIGFESPLSRPNLESRHPPPRTRTVLPALTSFEFYGASEYLEDLVARIDAPLLDWIVITFFHQFIFDTPQLALFMRRMPAFEALDHAHVFFNSDLVKVGSTPMTQTSHRTSWLRISCEKLDWQLSSVAQVFTSFFPSIYRVQFLTIDVFRDLPSEWQNDIENMRWLEFFQQFTTVVQLSVSQKFTRSIALALQELVGERVADVLPALRTITLEGFYSHTSSPVREAIKRFTEARRLSGHPVAVFY
jgi:hypothetical protein